MLFYQISSQVSFLGDKQHNDCYGRNNCEGNEYILEHNEKKQFYPAILRLLKRRLFVRKNSASDKKYVGSCLGTSVLPATETLPEQSSASAPYIQEPGRGPDVT